MPTALLQVPHYKTSWIVSRNNYTKKGYCLLWTEHMNQEREWNTIKMTGTAWTEPKKMVTSHKPCCATSSSPTNCHGRGVWWFKSISSVLQVKLIKITKTSLCSLSKVSAQVPVTHPCCWTDPHRQWLLVLQLLPETHSSLLLSKWAYSCLLTDSFHLINGLLSSFTEERCSFMESKRSDWPPDYISSQPTTAGFLYYLLGKWEAYALTDKCGHAEPADRNSLL